ncbi:MAG: murein hydrolase activator EnvC [Hyphomicrobiales bacterium]
MTLSWMQDRGRHGRRACAVAAALLLVTATGGSRAQENLTREQVREQLEERKGELAATRQRELELARELETLAREESELKGKLISAAQRVQASEARLSAIENRLGGLEEQRTSLRASISDRRESIASLLGSMQRIGHEPPPAVVTSRDDALKMVRSAMLLAAVYPKFKTEADRLGRELRDLNSLGDQIRGERDSLQGESRTLEAERQRIEQLLEEKKSRMTISADRLAEIRAAAKRHAESIQYLDELVARMDQEWEAARQALARAEAAARAEEEAARAAEAAKREAEEAQKTVTIAPNGKVAFLSPGRIKPAVPFSGARGTIALPAQGQQIRAFGAHDASGAPVRGVTLETRENAQVISPSDGWVVFADTFRDYGQLLIIDAGEGYHILLAGMRRIDVTIGQFVLAGEPVAVMGGRQPSPRSASSGSRPALYIEFRKDGRPIDPGPWWSQGSEKVRG